MNQSLVVAKLKVAFPSVIEQLPPWVDRERFRRVVHMALTKTPNLHTINPQSFVDACTKAAMDGLLPDGQQAAIIPYKGNARYSPMIGGLMFLARRSGLFESIAPVAVYEADEFEVFLGSDPRIHHKVCVTGDRGTVVAAYCTAKLADGWTEIEVMTRQQIDEVRKAAAPGSEAWKNYYDQMACKVVFRRLAKRLPLSEHMDSAFNHDNEGYDFRAAPNEPPVDITPAAEKPRARAAVQHQPEQEATPAPDWDDAEWEEAGAEMDAAARAAAEE